MIRRRRRAPQQPRPRRSLRARLAFLTAAVLVGVLVLPSVASASVLQSAASLVAYVPGGSQLVDLVRAGAAAAIDLARRTVVAAASAAWEQLAALIPQSQIDVLSSIVSTVAPYAAVLNVWLPVVEAGALAAAYFAWRAAAAAVRVLLKLTPWIW